MKTKMSIIRTATVAFLLAVLLVGCSDLIVGPAETNHNIEDFEAIGQIVRTRYPFLQFKRINWDSLLVIYRPMALHAEGDGIYSVLHSLLRELKDGHIELRTEGGFPTITYEWPRFRGGRAYSPLVVRRYFDRELKVVGDGNFEYELLTGNMGYIYLASFAEGDWVNDLDVILGYFSNTKGLIFDVRNNGGGNASIAYFITSRFTQSTVTHSFFSPDGSPNGKVTINPVGQYAYHKPVVMLINGASFSAAELLAELMKQTPTIRTVGDTTGGGGGGTEVFLLPSHKRIRIPTSYFKRFTGEMVEWNGIPPDILVPQTEADINQGRDKQLEYAITLLR